MLRVKAADTMAPLGPGLVTEAGLGPSGKRLRTYVKRQADGARTGVTRPDEMTWDNGTNYLVAETNRPHDHLLPRRRVLLSCIRHPGQLRRRCLQLRRSVVEVEVDGLGRAEGTTSWRAQFGILAAELRRPADGERGGLSTALGGDWEFARGNYPLLHVGQGTEATDRTMRAMASACFAPSVSSPGPVSMAMRVRTRAAHRLDSLSSTSGRDGGGVEHLPTAANAAYPQLT